MTVIPRQIAALSLAGAGLAALAACSSGGSSPAAAAGTASGSASPSTATSNTATSNTAASAAAATNAGLSDSALRAAFVSAANGASAVHVKGAVTQSGQVITEDIQLNKNESCDGTLSIGAAQLPVKATGGVYYLEFTPSFIQYIAKQQGADAAAFAAYSGKWVSSNGTLGKDLASSFSQFMSYSSMVKQVADNSDGDKATAAGTATLNGQSVALYNTTKGSKLYFAASGPAYMVEQVVGGSDGTGTIDYTWNQPTTVSPPPASQIYNG
jgi:hypothetical protein